MCWGTPLVCEALEVPGAQLFGLDISWHMECVLLRGDGKSMALLWDCGFSL